MINTQEVLLVTVAVSIVIVLTTFWIWAMVHCARRISGGETRLVGWLIAICLAHVFGAIAYAFFGRKPT